MQEMQKKHHFLLRNKREDLEFQAFTDLRIATASVSYLTKKVYTYRVHCIYIYIYIHICMHIMAPCMLYINQAEEQAVVTFVFRE